MGFQNGVFKNAQPHELVSDQVPTEKILQFGSGSLFRNLINPVISRVKETTISNARVVLIRSASDGLYIPLKSKDPLVSRVLFEEFQWPAILECATNPDLKIIISNRKLQGRTLLKDHIEAKPPFSFPGKLLAILFHRYQTFHGDPEQGLHVIFVGQRNLNAFVLESIVLELAHLNNLDPAFLDWIEMANHFSNSACIAEKY